MTYGDLNTNRGYNDIRSSLIEVFVKWGIADYQIPSWSAVTAAKQVTVEYVQNGRPVTLTPTRWAPTARNWQARSLAAIELMLDAIRKSEQRGLTQGMAEASAAVARLPPPSQKRPAYAVLGVMPDAPREVVEAAYRVQLKRLHPDTGGPGGDVLTEVLEAGEAMGIR